MIGRGTRRLPLSDGLLACLFFFVLANVAFYPFLWGDRTLLASSETGASLFATGALPGPATTDPQKGLDLGAPAWVTEPEFKLIHDQVLHEHVVPLWNPYEAFGDPLLASMEAQPFYPPALIAIAHPTPRGYAVFIVLRLFLVGIFGYLYLRFFTGFAAAIAGGTCCMFMGYLLLFYAMPEASVEVTISMLFFATELHLRRRTWYSALLLALSAWLVIVGGMPESSVFVMGLGVSYAVVRALMQPRGRRSPALLHAAAALTLGSACAAFFVLPSVEFIHNSTNVHELRYTHVATGLFSDPFTPQYVATYVAPLMFGPPFNSIMNHFSGHSGVRGFFGVIPLFFACIAAVSVLRTIRRRSIATADGVIAFFVVAVLLLLAKRYGMPAINWIGELPLLNVINFPKYEEVVIGFSMAMLTGFGFERAFSQSRARFTVTAAAALTFVIVASLALWALTLAGRINEMMIYYFASNASLLVLLVLVFAIVLLLDGIWWRAIAQDDRRVSRVRNIVLVLLCAEVIGNYFVPMFYVVTTEPYMTRNPYAGAAYVTFLQRMTAANYERTYGVGGALYPNWPGAYGLYDIRGLDALFYDRYLPFINAFFKRTTADPDELQNRFTGVIGLLPSSELEKRLLALSSVGFVVTQGVMIDPNTITGMAIDQNAGKIPPDRAAQFRADIFDINGDKRVGFLEHPVYIRLPIRVRVPRTDPRLRFAIGFDPATYARSICGEGVRYRLEVRDGGFVRSVFSEYIDPKHQVNERRWLDRAVDLGAYRGRDVELLFSTLPGPHDDTCMAWSLWGDPHFSASASRVAVPFPFHLVFNDDMRIYRFANPLPRATIYYSARNVANAADALAAVAAGKTDVRSTAIVEASQAAGALAQTPSGRVPPPSDAAAIISYKSQEVVLRAVARQPAVLVFNDANYPGWRAYLDGTSVPIEPANFLFRGVELPAGAHQVVFRYEPASWRIGVWVSLAAFLCLAAYAALLIARSSKRPDETVRSV